MHDDLVQLDHLDTLDREQWRRETRIQKLNTALADSHTTRSAKQAALDTAHAAVQANRDAEKAVQRRLSEYRNNRGSATRLLETGQGDPEAAQRQVDRCEALIDDAETEVLELLEVRDTLDTAEQQATEALGVAVEAEAALEASVPGECATLQSEIGDLLGERTRVFDALPRDIRSRYEGWRARGKWAVARIVRGACDACRMEIQAQHLADLRRGIVEPCRGCYRWIIPPDEG